MQYLPIWQLTSRFFWVYTKLWIYTNISYPCTEPFKLRTRFGAKCQCICIVIFHFFFPTEYHLPLDSELLLSNINKHLCVRKHRKHLGVQVYICTRVAQYLDPNEICQKTLSSFSFKGQVINFELNPEPKGTTWEADCDLLNHCLFLISPLPWRRTEASAAVRFL